MSGANDPDRFGRGFTLIEILVAISIIALLISILIPALAKARDAGRAAVCLSNLKQMGTAATLYANANDGFVPREGVDDATKRERPPWAVALRPYIDSGTSSESDVNDLFSSAPYFRDPSRKKDRHVLHYVVNAIPFKEPGVPDPTAALNWRKRRGPTKLDRIINASGVVYMTDYFDDPDGKRADEIYSGPLSDMSVAQWYDLWLGSHVTGGPASRRMEPKRHGTGCNMLFFDTHASSVSATEAREIKLWDDGLKLLR